MIAPKISHAAWQQLKSHSYDVYAFALWLPRNEACVLVPAALLWLEVWALTPSSRQPLAVRLRLAWLRQEIDSILQGQQNQEARSSEGSSASALEDQANSVTASSPTLHAVATLMNTLAVEDQKRWVNEFQRWLDRVDAYLVQAFEAADNADGGTLSDREQEVRGDLWQWLSRLVVSGLGSGGHRGEKGDKLGQVLAEQYRHINLHSGEVLRTQARSSLGEYSGVNISKIPEDILRSEGQGYPVATRLLVGLTRHNHRKLSKPQRRVGEAFAQLNLLFSLGRSRVR